ncbi:hypothetical protein AHS86_03955 [Salmonella enterica subsp. enterica]|nr:hypothetical protein [Salmonella enterica subsp. enterica]ECH9148369.1 hypothetical protein [Salmonella enterica subsp. enterica]
MFAIRPNDFYRCIMSPNMMLARTRPLPIQQGPFFLLHISSRSSVGRLAHPGHVTTYVPALLQLELFWRNGAIRNGHSAIHHGLRAISTARCGAG